MEKMSRTRQVTINAATNYIRFFFSMIVSFWLIPFIIRSLGQDMYGLWTLSFSLIGFFSLLDFGFGLGVVKWTGESRVTGEYEYRNHMLSTVFFVYVLVALVGMVLLGGFSFFYAKIFSIPKPLQSTAVAVLLILGLRSLLIQIPLSLFKGILFGEQRIYQINIIQTIGTLLYAGSAFVVLSQGKGVVYLAIVNCVSFLLENLLYFLFAYKKVAMLSISPRKIQKKYFREAVSFSFYSFLTTIAGLVLFQTDVIIIQITLNLSLVGLYSVAIKISEYAFLLTKQLVNVLTPLISELKEKKEYDSIRFLLLDLSKYIMATGVILTATIYVFGKDLLLFWVGSEFADATIPLLLLMTSFMISIPELVASNVLTMTGNQKFTAKVSILSIIVNIGSSLLLVRPLGLVGIALGTVISSFVNNVLLTLSRAAKEYEFPAHWYLTKVFLPTCLPGIVLVGIGFAITYFYPVNSVWDLIIKAIPGGLAYLIIFWFFYTDKKMKMTIIGKFTHKPPVKEM
ncbi:membrane protein involved in the export of O-antigen and teichoic acid [Sphaerochaeta pleomorpha str. Grapes]|uniref:Membrane protein involved in the export of O-antigen and teichoic acid n=1 Tax=Sphaerochaeta pleomorpha (strain ATCC BAA-1885 / DSM 22778 / Grapes) TaxID=158190 RepID=G8QS24_SPHPG|nr:flippase [Sphaerochaeta pleomorpha]AEV30022.1 membrane protein involved in the export of O-antigen and teichoic acid [Sphaerochaeta pleomorpha str. Grapes]